MVSEVSTWFPASPAPTADRAVSLFCFPHGGGDASAYRHWQRAIAADVEVVPAALPGRERRIAEPLVPSIASLADALLEPVTSRAGDRGLALFGHSMGALIAFELAHRLTAAGRRPDVLVVSGAEAPQARSGQPRVHHLPDAEFLRYISTLEGTPAGVLDIPDLRALLLPVLRADFQACETYECAARPPLDLPVLVLGGDADPRVPVAGLELWREVTTGPVTIETFPGGHFFVVEQLDEVLAAIGSAVRGARDVTTGPEHR